MLLNKLNRRDLGLVDSLQDSFGELFVSRLRCNRPDTFSCPSKGYEGSDPQVPPFVAKFSPMHSMEHTLLVASEEGEIFVHNTLDTNGSKQVAKIDAHDNAIFDICWMHDSPSFITVSGDKTAALWDFSTQSKLFQFRGHKCSIKSVDVRPYDNSVFATGGRDGNIMLWDKRSVCRSNPCHAVNILHNVHQIREPASLAKSKSKMHSDSYYGVTSVLFQDSSTLISSGAVDGDIKFWDIRRSYSAYRNVPLPVKSIPYAGNSIKQLGYTSMVLDSSGCRLYANCTDNVIYEYNCTSCQLVFKYTGHKSSSFFVKSALCPRNRFLLSGSMDEYAYIWKVGESSQPLYRLNGHRDEVTSVDWCKSDDVTLVTCCDDMKYRVWRTAVNNSEPQPDDGEVEKIINHGMTSSNTDPSYCRRISHNGPVTCQSPLQEINLNCSREFASPTLNLPNLIVDQQSTPDNKVYLSKSTPGRPSNWLTEISATRKSRQSIVKCSVSRIKKMRKRTRIDKCLENYFKIV